MSVPSNVSECICQCELSNTKLSFGIENTIEHQTEIKFHLISIVNIKMKIECWRKQQQHLCISLQTNPPTNGTWIHKICIKICKCIAIDNSILFFPFRLIFFFFFYTFSLLSGKVERTQNTHHLVPKITIRCSKIYGLNEERSYFNVIFNGANGIWEPGGETIQCNFLFLLLVGTTICCHSKCISMKKKGITLICIIFELSLHE